MSTDFIFTITSCIVIGFFIVATLFLLTSLFVNYFHRKKKCKTEQTETNSQELDQHLKYRSNRDAHIPLELPSTDKMSFPKMIAKNYETKRGYFELCLCMSSVRDKITEKELELISHHGTYHYQIGFKEGLEYALKHSKDDIEKGLEHLSGFGDVVEF